MNRSTHTRRRRLLQAGAAALAIAALRPSRAWAANNKGLVTRPVGAHAERLAVVGLGTNRFRLDKREQIRQVLQRMAELGGQVIDTAPAYGESEETLGRVIAELGLRDKFFLATKLTAGDAGAANALGPAASLERSLARLRTDRIDLLQVHNLQGTAQLMPALLEWRRSGKIRYIGLTTSRTAQHAQLLSEMDQYPVDFIQVDYSLGNRAAAEAILPAAAAKKIAVLVNLPLGGGRGANVVSLAGTRPLPAWAQKAGIETWSQFGLVFVTSHPAVTCAIPGTTQAQHLAENLLAARVPLVSASMRQQMQEFWDREVIGGTTPPPGAI
jgi:aryl-alcohol dehydrogenase-like predicted oxidoreductase